MIELYDERIPQILGFNVSAKIDFAPLIQKKIITNSYSVDFIYNTGDLYKRNEEVTNCNHSFRTVL